MISGHDLVGSAGFSCCQYHSSLLTSERRARRMCGTFIASAAVLQGACRRWRALGLGFLRLLEAHHDQPLADRQVAAPCASPADGVKALINFQNLVRCLLP